MFASKNEHVDAINESVHNFFSGDSHTSFSFDSVVDDNNNLYPLEFINYVKLGGVPPHELTLKGGVLIMLCRNLNPSERLCNGTRLVCCNFHKHVMEAEIITGDRCGKRVLLPRLPLMASEDASLPLL